jgi:hypothetical protein
MADLRVGGKVVDRQSAAEYARRYLTDGSGWAFPSYDRFDDSHATGPLVDADLLAPLLLNVTRISISTYEALRAVRKPLQTVLDRIPLELRLENATNAELGYLGDLFGVLDGAGIKGARGTVLSKMLHRKRPAFIPLYDKRVGRVFQHGHDGGQPRIPAVPDRSWGEFAPVFGAAIQADLQRELPLWQEIAALAPGRPITALRALDIVAWWAGHRDDGDLRHATTPVAQTWAASQGQPSNA